MRPVVLQMGVTLDGFVHGARGYQDWGLPPEDDEVVAWKVASLREAGTHIMGRATYEAMASVWPNTTGVYADVMNEHPVAIGHGAGLFSALREPLRLDLIEVRSFPSGTAIHVYQPKERNR